MGGWKLETFKMGMYIMFPVGLFHYFNQPRFYKDWVEKSLEELYKPETPEILQFREELKRIKDKQEREMQAELEKQIA